MSHGLTDKDVPDQTGKTALVTGANTGLGFHAALALAGRGARVLLGCRSRQKAEAARQRIVTPHPEADVAVVELDLADLASVRDAAARVAEEPRLDILVNNAGIMFPPFELTGDGFESQFGVNHLGPFALTGLLLPVLARTPRSRIVNTSSVAHKVGKLNLENLNARHGYSKSGQYAMSKLANLLHMRELDRRLRASSHATMAVAAHPGLSATELSRHMNPWTQKLFPVVRPLMNTAAQGAWPTLMAATWPEARGGDYFGPGGFMEMTGPAKPARSSQRSQDPHLAEKLWDISVELTGVGYDFSA